MSGQSGLAPKRTGLDGRIGKPLMDSLNDHGVGTVVNLATRGE